jgi:hypothetical protein
MLVNVGSKSFDVKPPFNGMTINNTMTLLSFPHLLRPEVIKYIGVYDFSQEIFEKFNESFLIYLHMSDFFTRTMDNIKVDVEFSGYNVMYFCIKTLEDEILMERKLNVNP